MWRNLRKTPDLRFAIIAHTIFIIKEFWKPFSQNSQKHGKTGENTLQRVK
ncbi:hypothetical protein NIES4101_40290 [Calothrix sp. NIES-4101]|nr:hypothetical protein NIES4101_40290 [Calothrix sp. NIES-4101]